MPATVDDTDAAVENGTYKTLPDAELTELLKVCGKWVMTNDASKHRIDYLSDTIRTELNTREANRKHAATQRVAWFATWAAILGVIVTIVLWSLDHRHPQPDAPVAHPPASRAPVAPGRDHAGRS